MKLEDYMKKEALSKEAWPDWSTLGIAGTGGKKALELASYLVGVPLLVGSGIGYVASKVTSPAETDVETLQQEALLTKLKAETGLRQRAMLARKRLQELQDEMNQGPKRKDNFLRL